MYWLVPGLDGLYIFYVTMQNIQLANINRYFSARTYMIISKNGKTEFVVYTDYSEENNSRSPYEVATRAIADDEVADGYKKFLQDNYINVIN